MNSNRGLASLAAFFAAFILFNASMYTLSEWEQAVITQFGRPVGAPVNRAGLHFKLPFIQMVRRLDKRILNWDGYPNQIPTKDKKYIWVDTTARWRIVDPLLFIQTVQTESGARLRLDGILDSVTRDTISNHNLVEAVRNSNAILDRVRKKLEEVQKKGDLAPGAEEEEITGEIERVTVGREALSAIIIDKARAGLKEFGIEIIDVQLRRIAYEASVEAKVYERMISERQRIAQKIRSVGLGEQAKIQGKINKDLQGIESEAYRKVQSIKGDADAKATRIYAQTMNSDPDFYSFTRTLEAYRRAIPADSTLILSTDNKFLEFFRKKY
ncbi:MAG: HflC protein [Elusimicrobia bacterium RIFCSPHIGHO2_02_FULL_57_9]|nr:MAG: HflC protein [Elusimicrobia bacterium RIFCSPHIGHO2_02_FULL_57_9]